jgi:hypothetical protein
LGAKEAALHVLDGLTGFLVFSLMTVAFHEYLHANVARAFGGSATVVYYLFSGYTAVEGAFTPWQLALIALSGGLGCFLLFLYMFLWWLEDPSDKYTRVPCLYFLVNQLVYGWLELAGLIYPLLIPFPIACLVATVVALGATLIYMFRYWD